MCAGMEADLAKFKEEADVLDANKVGKRRLRCASKRRLAGEQRESLGQNSHKGGENILAI